jgi:Low specificity phosphatase (HAD superfamily)
MKVVGYSACPKDSHIKIKKISDLVLDTNGGNGVIRELYDLLL